MLTDISGVGRTLFWIDKDHVWSHGDSDEIIGVPSMDSRESKSSILMAAKFLEEYLETDGNSSYTDGGHLTEGSEFIHSSFLACDGPAGIPNKDLAISYMGSVFGEKGNLSAFAVSSFWCPRVTNELALDIVRSIIFGDGVTKEKYGSLGNTWGIIASYASMAVFARSVVSNHGNGKLSGGVLSNTSIISGQFARINGDERSRQFGVSAFLMRGEHGVDPSSLSREESEAVKGILYAASLASVKFSGGIMCQKFKAN